jgi:hypothetical protein
MAQHRGTRVNIDWLTIGKEVIKYGAPMLGFAIAGPAGASFGSSVASMFGAGSSDTMDLLSKMSSDPQVTVKLAQLENDKAIELQTLMVQQIEAQYKHEETTLGIEEQDVEAARNMELQTKDWMPHVLTGVSITLMVIILYAMFKIPIPDNNKFVAMIIFLSIAYVFFMSCRFYLGGIIPPLSSIKDIKSLL